MSNAKASKPKTASYWICAIVGILVMIFGGFIPGPGAITQCGMAVLGIFVGLIFLIATVDLIWPSFLAILIFGFWAPQIYPESGAAGLDTAIIQSFGHSVTVFIIFMLLLCEALREAGVMRRMALWFVSRSFAKKGAWPFTFMLMLAGFVIAAIMDPVPAALAMIMVSKELFEAIGFKKGDAYPKMVVCCMCIIAAIGFGMTPIGHNLPVAILSITPTASGVPVNVFQYCVVGLPIGILTFLGMFFYFKLIVKPDVTPFETLDYKKIDDMRPGKMNTKEKIVTIVSLAVLILWVLPGFLDIIAPGTAFGTLLNTYGLNLPILSGIIILAVVKVDGKPILNIMEAAKHISWTTIFMFGGIIMIAVALSQDSTGIMAWMNSWLSPIFSGMHAFLAVAIVAILVIVLTNLLNDIAVGFVVGGLAAPIAASAGLNPGLLIVVAAAGCCWAYTTPAASPVMTFAVTDTYCDSKYVLKHGIIVFVINLVVAAFLAYPLGSLVF